MERNKVVITAGWKGSFCLYILCLTLIVAALALKSSYVPVNSDVTANVLIIFCTFTGLTYFAYSSISQAKKKRENRFKQRQKAKEDVIKQIQQANNALKQQWQQQMSHHARQLAELFASENYSESQKHTRAVDIGLAAWKQGGVECMNHLREMAVEIYSSENGDASFVDHTPYWWDGVGGWRNSSDMFEPVVGNRTKKRQTYKKPERHKAVS